MRTQKKKAGSQGKVVFLVELPEELANFVIEMERLGIAVDQLFAMVVGIVREVVLEEEQPPKQKAVKKAVKKSAKAVKKAPATKSSKPSKRPVKKASKTVKAKKKSR